MKHCHIENCKRHVDPCQDFDVVRAGPVSGETSGGVAVAGGVGAPACQETGSRGYSSLGFKRRSGKW
jgi:hypothetical protein